MTPAQRSHIDGPHRRRNTAPHIRRARMARELVLVAIALACAAAACVTWWTP